MNATLRRNIRRFNSGKRLSERIITNSLELLGFPEFRSILLADKTQTKSFFKDKFLSHEAFINMKKIQRLKKKSQIEELELINELDKVLFNKLDVYQESWIDIEDQGFMETDELDSLEKV